GIRYFHVTGVQTCALPISTGGPKDSIPPVILNELPANLTRNFKQKEIVLTFDEYIKLNNQHKEFSISPDLDKQPEYRVKKKDLIITRSEEHTSELQSRENLVCRL